MKNITNQLGYHFSTGGEAGADYLNFQRAAQTDLKRKATAAGFELHRFNKNHYEFSAVLKHAATGQFVYISISDVRFFPDEWYSHMLYRTMKHETDWTGGQNHYCCWDDLSTALEGLVA